MRINRIPSALSKLRSLLRFCGAVMRRFHEDDGFRLCASLAYTSLFAVVPVVMVGLAIFAAFPAFDAFTQTIQRFFAANMLPGAFAQTMLEYIDQFARNAGRLTAVGTIAVAVTAFLLMETIERAFNQIWRVRRSRPFVNRFFIYWGVMTLGPILVGASLTLTSYVITHAAELTAKWPWITELLLRAVPAALMAIAFFLLYLVVPGKMPAPRHALAGGIAAALMFEAMKYGFAQYLRSMPSFTLVYGTLAAFPIFLMWLYLSWVVAAIGAEITALAPDFHNVSPRHTTRPEPEFRDSLLVLRSLVEAQRAGRAAHARRIANESALPLELTTLVLEGLEAKGWVGRVQPDRWALLGDPELLTIAEVFRRQMLERSLRRSSKTPAEERPVDPIDRVLADLDRGVEASLALPVAALVPPADPAKALARRVSPPS